MRKLQSFITFVLVLTMVLSLSVSAQAEIAEYKTAGSGSTGQTVRNLQKRLNDLGYNAGDVDGVFAQGTKKAVEAFQEMNGLEISGVADPETQEKLFSSSAKKAYLSEVEIMDVTWFADKVSITFRGNIREYIDSITYYVYTHDLRGNLYAANTNPEEAEMLRAYTSTVGPLAPGVLCTVECSLSPNVIDGKVLYVSVGIRSFHTTSGREYEYSPEQMLFIRNDGYAVYPQNAFGPEVMDDEDVQQASTIRFGYAYYEMPAWVAPLYGFLEGGEWILSVEEGSPLALAGLRTNDLILTFDGEPALYGHANETAKLRLLNGEAVSVRYLRNGEKLIAVLSDIAPTEAADTDQPEAAPEPEVTPEPVLSTPEPEATPDPVQETPVPVFVPSPAPEGLPTGGSSDDTPDNLSLVEQLEQLAALYQSGLLTDEEFAAAKAILLKGTSNG